MMSERESHGMNCAHRSDSDEPCTCACRYHAAVDTERTMHAAWRKRAEEAEIENADLRAKLAAATKTLGEAGDEISHLSMLASNIEQRAERAEKARDEAQARVDALEADAMKAMHEASVLRRLEYNQVGRAGQVEAVVRSPFMWILGEWIAAYFKANGGTNYVEQELKLTIASFTAVAAVALFITAGLT